MVGPLSAAGAMVERMSAAHRWCVTGTPLGGFHELDDLHGLLIALGHDPLGGSEAWRRLVRRRLAAGRGDLAWRALRAALLPLLWRSTKAVVAEEHALPPRSLAASRLAFQPGEAEFYGQVLERTRDARARLRFLQEAAGGAGEGGAGRAGQAQGHRKKAKTGLSRAEEEALAGATQLRLACTHPQLTRHWKNLQSDLQLTLGGTLSMEVGAGRHSLGSKGYHTKGVGLRQLHEGDTSQRQSGTCALPRPVLAIFLSNWSHHTSARLPMLQIPFHP